MTDTPPPPPPEPTRPFEPPTPPLPPVPPSDSRQPLPPTMPPQPDAYARNEQYPQSNPYAQVPPAKPTDGLAIAALITGIFFWPAGLVISPIAMSRTKKSGAGGRGLAIAGLIISIALGVFTVIAIVVTVISIVLTAAAAKSVIDSLPDSTYTSPFDDSTAVPLDGLGEVDASVGIGETGVTSTGMSFTVNAFECGITHVGDADFGADPQGQFCRVDVTVGNESADQQTFISSYSQAYSGETEYDSDITAVFYSDDPGAFSSDIAPGASVDTSVYFDVPLDTTVDRLTFADSFIGNKVEVLVQ